MTEFLNFTIERLPELWGRLGEHIMMTGVSVLLACIIGIPLGVVAARYWFLRSPITGTAGIFQTIPSLAMLALLLILIGKAGLTPTIIALTLYALLPIVRNTLAGLQGVPKATVEAARGIGMKPTQSLIMVELPLAMPFIVAGIRTAAVVNVGITTIAAYIGAGGLGTFITRGLALNNNNLLWLGIIPCVILALVVDGSLASMLWGLDRQRIRSSAKHRRFKRKIRPFAVAMPATLVAVGLFIMSFNPFVVSNNNETIRIGSKDYTEQVLLAEIMAQLIEAKTDLNVDRKFNLGGTLICHESLVNGELDLYAEYTGTSLTAVLHNDVITDPDKAYDAVAKAYKDQFDLNYLNPFGFNNTYTITVREEDAKKNNWKTISDLIPVSKNLNAGFDPEFGERPDGYPGLKKKYGLTFKSVSDYNQSLMYSAAANKQVDVICAYGTDGRIPAYNLAILKDDRNFFPPYYAAPVVRQQTFDKHPELRDLLNTLGNQLNDAQMQKLNFEVDENKRTPRDVANEFLKSKNLIK